MRHLVRPAKSLHRDLPLDRPELFRAALQQCIDAVPTDGLGITASDFDQIGVSDYETADQVLIDYLNGDTSASDHPVIKRHEGSAFKRMDPQSIQREVLLQ